MISAKTSTDIITANQSRKQLAKRFGVKIKYVQPVKIFEITDHGFRLQVLDRDYYLTRERYPWFGDATDEEIEDVALVFESTLKWKSLDLFYSLEQLDHPEESGQFGCYVRGVHRPDLFIGFKERFPQFSQSGQPYKEER